VAPGLDSTKEELHAYEEPFLNRGIATLAIDGRGARARPSTSSRICGDYERAARAVVDWIEKRKDLDSKKMAIWVLSLGGYYAPRAAAYENGSRPASRCRVLRVGADLGRLAGAHAARRSGRAAIQKTRRKPKSMPRL